MDQEESDEDYDPKEDGHWSDGFDDSDNGVQDEFAANIDNDDLRSIASLEESNIDPVFKLGMQFKSHEVFRNALKEYAMKWGRSFEVKHVKAKWIIGRYCEHIRLNPTWLISSLMDTISHEHAIKVDKQVVRRAKKKYIELIEGSA
ncbi:hypothetical protein Dimus_022481, partial [Dionaea muscipula]